MYGVKEDVKGSISGEERSTLDLAHCVLVSVPVQNVD